VFGAGLLTFSVPPFVTLPDTVEDKILKKKEEDKQEGLEDLAWIRRRSLFPYYRNFLKISVKEIHGRM